MKRFKIISSDNLLTMDGIVFGDNSVHVRAGNIMRLDMTAEVWKKVGKEIFGANYRIEEID